MINPDYSPINFVVINPKSVREKMRMNRTRVP